VRAGPNVMLLRNAAVTNTQARPEQVNNG